MLLRSPSIDRAARHQLADLWGGRRPPQAPLARPWALWAARRMIRFERSVKCWMSLKCAGPRRDGSAAAGDLKSFGARIARLSNQPNPDRVRLSRPSSARSNGPSARLPENTE